jgi:hypothetical protein
MTAQLTAQKISNYLCSVRLTTLVADRLILLLTSLNKHACTMKHLPNPTRANKDSVPTSRRVWNSNLSQVLTLHNTATKAAGVKSTYTFEEYVASLLDQAAVHDSATSTGGRNQTRTQCQRHGVMLRRWHDRTRRSQWVRELHS